MHILTKHELAGVLGGVAGLKQAAVTPGGQKQQQKPNGMEGNNLVEAKPLPFLSPANQPPPINGFQPVIGAQRLGGTMPVPEQAQKA